MKSLFMTDSQFIIFLISFSIPLIISGLADFFELRKIRKIILLFEARILRLEDNSSDE